MSISPRYVLLSMSFSCIVLLASAVGAGAVGLGTTCGGLAGIKCNTSLLCELPAGKCSAADLQGKCVKQPQICTKEYRPVCGCNGKTYGNDCERRAAGVQKQANGACKTSKKKAN